jgi:multidrug efflux pump subunit AcrB
MPCASWSAGDQRVSRFRDESVSEDYDVQLRLSEGDRQDIASISRLFVPRASGGWSAWTMSSVFRPRKPCLE